MVDPHRRRRRGQYSLGGVVEEALVDEEAASGGDVVEALAQHGVHVRARDSAGRARSAGPASRARRGAWRAPPAAARRRPSTTNAVEHAAHGGRRARRARRVPAGGPAPRGRRRRSASTPTSKRPEGPATIHAHRAQPSERRGCPLSGRQGGRRRHLVDACSAPSFTAANTRRRSSSARAPAIDAAFTACRPPRWWPRPPRR